MVLTTYDWIYGSGQIGAVILSLLAGCIALSMFKLSRERKLLRAWRYMIWALVLFVVVETVGALRTFGIWSSPWLTHVLAGIILALLITALIVQINVTRGMNDG